MMELEKAKELISEVLKSNYLAITKLKEDGISQYASHDEVKQALQTCLDFIQSYLTLSKSGGWPKEKGKVGSLIPLKNAPHKYTNEQIEGVIEGYNQARQVFLVCLMKKLEGMLHNLVTPELVEKHFPKGECKERGKAIALHAEILIAIEKYLIDNHLTPTIGDKL